MTVPEFPRVCGPGQNRLQEVFHWGLHDCTGGVDILKIYV